jgi:WhiB family transcriptional regulator, redox-sensing transcriptional regulator
MGNRHWVAQAACQGQPLDALFVRGAAAQHAAAKKLCAGCSVRTECLAEALDARIGWGVWGGLTERERRQVLRRRPNVRSWRMLLEHARARHLERDGAEQTVPARGQNEFRVGVASDGVRAPSPRHVHSLADHRVASSVGREV